MVSERRQFCTFWMGQRLYGMPVDEVQEVMREQAMTRVPLAGSSVRGLINLRGKIVTAIDLRKGLGLGEEKIAGPLMNVVVSSEEYTVSFLVDAIGDVLDVGEESYEKVPETLQGEERKLVAGVYKLPSGLLHVLDAEKCVQIVNPGKKEATE
ncbi:MAG TPA: chemotaxis protein CheW [Candidatus Acidoferrum sp.]|nr:chemotaxis protein CheW [Candidatus Acidoferrum sp.]